MRNQNNKQVNQLYIRVRGRVQGVWFRASTERKAKELGLTGYVQNEPDGSVSIIAEGIPEKLQELVQWCHHGPPMARVEQVNVESNEQTGFDDFVQVR